MRRVLACALLWLAAACPVFGAETDPALPQVLVMLRMPPAHFRPDSHYAGAYGDAAGHSARRNVAQRLAREHGLTLVTDWPLPLLGLDCYVMGLPADRLPEQVADTLSGDPRVAWAQAVHVFQAQGHDDALYGAQPAAHEWRLAELHALATGRQVRVAVVDSAVDASHPDLAGQVLAAENFVDDHAAVAERHGTAVAGVIAARADNGIGIAGVAPQARLMALRACWQASADSTLCTSLSLARALHFAIDHGAQVINLSLAGPPDRLLGELLDAALANAIVVVGAADPARPNAGFPASHPGVVAVTDVSPGPAGAVLAPGRDVPTTVPGGRWEIVSGASYSAAHVAGLFALLRELGAPRAGAHAAAALVRLPMGGIDSCATLLHVVGPCACSCALAPAAAAPGHS